MYLDNNVALSLSVQFTYREQNTRSLDVLVAGILNSFFASLASGAAVAVVRTKNSSTFVDKCDTGMYRCQLLLARVMNK